MLSLEKHDDKLIFIVYITERPLDLFGQGKQGLVYSNNWDLGWVDVLHTHLITFMECAIIVNECAFSRNISSKELMAGLWLDNEVFDAL